MAREGIKMKGQNVTVSSRQTDLEAKLLEIRAAGRTMRSQISAVEGRIKDLEVMLTDARMALEKLTDKSARTKADLRAENVAIESSFEAEEAHIKSLNRELATEVMKKQQPLAERRGTSQTSSPPLAEGEDCLPGLQSKLAAMTVERVEWFVLATETAEKLKAAEANIALQLTLRKTAREEMDTHTARVAELQEQLLANGPKLPQLSAQHSKLTDEMSRVKS